AAGKPAAGVLEIRDAFRALEAVLQLIGHALTGIDLTRLRDEIGTALPCRGFDMPCKRTAARDVFRCNTKHVDGIVRPDQIVAVESPFVGDLADRLEDARGIEITGVAVACHVCPFLGLLRLPGERSCPFWMLGA